MTLTNWQILDSIDPPTWIRDRVGKFAAQLLWQRGFVSPEQVSAFLDIEAYQPTSAFALPEMAIAIARIQTAYERGETIAIWGDFDADGITATSVLWEGLGQFFAQGDRLVFYIPDRLKESHGISLRGLDELRSQCEAADKVLSLIITCDTGSTSLAALSYAQELGIDTIVTDHHTLPDERPPVTAIINPRYLNSDHPLFHLSGVAVAYKLMEALYATMPEVPQQPLEDLLDLVAIGLVADLVQLTGDCRYLAQKGIEVLRQKKRLGVRMLLEQCKRVGDRPIDISFGIAPRINAVSRIWGDVRKCVELLTTQDEQLCKALIEQTEMANTQRKALQKRVFKQVQAKIAQLDLSTVGIIVLVDPQWSVGILGLVAGQVVAEYGRPTILCTLEDDLAKGSARSLEGINLYDLLKGQEHLLQSFGGHPLAGGLSFQIENLQVLIEAIDRSFWSQYGVLQSKKITIDLEVEIADLNKDLFNELKQLEPFGMGNSYPRLLVRNCHFSDISNANIRTPKGQKVEYIKTEFTLSDRQGNRIHGDWWGHYSYELPDTPCDIVIELVDNAFRKRYDVRLIDFHAQSTPLANEIPALAKSFNKADANLKIIDWRGKDDTIDRHLVTTICDRCPQSWQDLNTIIASAQQANQSLALTYPNPQKINGKIAWQTLVGIAKYLSRTGKEIKRSQLVAKLGIGDRDILQMGFEELQQYGYVVRAIDNPLDPDNPTIRIEAIALNTTPPPLSQKFIQAANELTFQQQFFDHQLQQLAQ
ncbi:MULTISPECIES: single-stranded-DNA-specific exonuclease RecJ [Pseudanabaena]|uniref:Single-stranded-DNA-specific exonuclease RecJ n=2 Tax=Pseudanabaena TaxID=1152 RepID=L8N6D0_9CYAN|nr:MULTISPECIES: single-stranded-DNA-specific exonuclease RecJ [Pseudanabaena]ELS34255.1 putative exonuclease, RecJ [Pseudanabaena biceps PCC 7429]MDG3493552.1 single-stranded-DNA-specific exonuclease RecJ [Pseudanabaena catenata USMAC16]